MTTKPLRIGICAGEPSGDKLGAGLMHALSAIVPQATFEGVPGALMRRAGCSEIFPMEQIAVMGFTQILKNLPRLLRLRRQIIRYFTHTPPDIFIGIDAPEFNLYVERVLKRHHIKTVHYVSPTLWAWREKRIHSIARSVDLMLTLFPFEVDIYHQHQVSAVWVGHPLADEIDFSSDKHKAREALAIQKHQPIIAILPGSRQLELKYLGHLFLRTADLCLQKIPGLHFVIPLVSKARWIQMQQLMAEYPIPLPITLVEGNAQTVMSASDAVLLSSGTATLEAMMINRPMVVAYCMNWLNWQILHRIVKVSYISLPNLLANKALVPEYIQAEATAEHLSEALLMWLTSSDKVNTLHQAFTALHQSLRQNASQKAAKAILKHCI